MLVKDLIGKNKLLRFPGFRDSIFLLLVNGKEMVKYMECDVEDLSYCIEENGWWDLKVLEIDLWERDIRIVIEGGR